MFLPSSRTLCFRRRSERVTDLERRALAEKIRQENVRQEQEMLSKLRSEKEKAELELPESANVEEVPQPADVEVVEAASKQSRAGKVKTTSAKDTLESPTKLVSGRKGKEAAVKTITKPAKRPAVLTDSDSPRKQVCMLGLFGNACQMQIPTVVLGSFPQYYCFNGLALLHDIFVFG